MTTWIFAAISASLGLFGLVFGVYQKLEANTAKRVATEITADRTAKQVEAVADRTAKQADEQIREDSSTRVAIETLIVRFDQMKSSMDDWVKELRQRTHDQANALHNVEQRLAVFDHRIDGIEVRDQKAIERGIEAMQRSLEVFAGIASAIQRALEVSSDMANNIREIAKNTKASHEPPRSPRGR